MYSPSASHNQNGGSFIPKQTGSGRRQKKTRRRKLVILSVVAYVVLFASLLAAGGAYFYLNYETTLLEQEVSKLNKVVSTFKVNDLNSVKDLDTKLQQANERLQNTASAAAVLEAIDSTTVEPAFLRSLAVERKGDEVFAVKSEIVTPSFEAAMFQRQVYTFNTNLLSDVSTKDVQYVKTVISGEGDRSPRTTTEVSLTADFIVPLEDVRYVIDPIIIEPVVIEVASSSDSLSVDFVEATTTDNINENNI